MSPVDAALARDPGLSRASRAFGLAAIVAIVFNTLLAWIKDAYDPLNNFMAALTGHHWITHSLVDLAVFFGFGAFFMRRNMPLADGALTLLLALACVAGGAGLTAWFLFF